MAAREWDPEARHRLDDLDELRNDVLRFAIYAVLGCDALVLLAMLAVPTVFLPSWGISTASIVAVAIVSAIAFWARRLGIRAASITLTLGLGLILSALVNLYPAQTVAPWLVIDVILVAALLGSRGGYIAAAALSAALVATKPAVLGNPIDWLDLSMLGLIWTTAILAWITSYPLGRALEWAWRSYVQALQVTQELQKQQGQLTRTLKSLNEAYERLEEVNHELERAREAAEQARRLKSQFAANISHELRTPLNLIVGFADMVANAPNVYAGEVLPVAYRGDVEAIHRNATHLASLIDDVLDLSQIDAGRMGLYKEWIVLPEVVAEGVRAVEALFARKNLTVVSDLPDELPRIYADRARLRQVFMNLLANAVKFTETGGVRISATRRGNDVVVSVADTGIGIAPNDLTKVFEEFRQLDDSIRRRNSGSGLGLAISKHFIELHGGAIWAESESGKGTTFFFSIPLHSHVISETIRRDWETWARLLPDQDEPVPTVMVVGEDPGIDRIFQRHLDGYQVLSVPDAEGGSQLLRQTTVDAVIVVGSPQASSGPTLPPLPKIPPGMPVIACSMAGRHEASEDLAVADFLVKPVSREALLAALDHLGRHVRRVLVVDDDPSMVKLLAQMIRSASRRYRVLRAYAGEEALQMLHEQRPDALVLDLSMPNMDGYDLLARLRMMPDVANTPVIVVTALGYEIGGVGCRVTTITREGGLGTGELLGCLKHVLDELLSSPHSDRAQSRAVADSEAWGGRQPLPAPAPNPPPEAPSRR